MVSRVVFHEVILKNPVAIPKDYVHEFSKTPYNRSFWRHYNRPEGFRK